MLGVTFGNKHSYNDWGIWLEDSHKNPPLPKRYIVDVPARNGLLELTPELTPIIRFENRTLTFTFRVKAGDWSSIESMIYGDVHGKTLDVVSDLDPNWHWHGCVTVDDFASDERTGVIVITVDAYPFKLSNTENSYTVNGNGTITCEVDRMEISPAFEVEAPTTVIYGDSSYVIESTATTEKTLSGDIVSFVDGTANPAADLIVNIEAVQSGSGDPSPTNVRPISGWGGVNVTRTGKNLLASASLKNGVYISNTTGAELSYATWSASDYIPMQINTRYRLLRLNDGNYTPVVGSNLYWAAYDKDFNYVTGGIGDGIISSNSAIKYMRVSASTANLTKGVLALNSDIDDFVTEADYIDGTTYSITWQTEAGTVYGGTLDVTTGGLTLTHEYADLGDLTWTKLTNESWNCFYTTPANKAYGVDNFINSNYEFGVIYGTTNDKVIRGSANSATIYIRDSDYMSGDASAFKTAMSGVQLVYELATPQVVQLTPKQVTTLLGQNNIWADSGEVEVTYIAQDFAGKKFYIPDLELTEGSHELTIQGTGTTTVTYTNGRL